MAMMEEGYIKLHRKMLEWEWYDDTNTKVVFLHLLFTANWREKRWRGVVIKPGQLVTGRKRLAEELKMTEREIRTSLSKLEKTGEIALQTTNKWTLVTIENWAKYQLCDVISDQQNANERPTSGQQTTTTKESKNIKDSISTNVDISQKVAYEDFVTAWNSICVSLPKVKMMTDARRKKINARLEDFSEEDLLEAMRLVQDSGFLSGRNGGWKATFDWLFQNSTNVAKVLEGNYKDKPRMTRTESEFEAARRRIQEQYERVTSTGARTASS